MVAGGPDRASSHARRGVQRAAITHGCLVIVSRKPIQVGVRAPGEVGVRPFADECLAEPVQFRAGQADAAAQLIQRVRLRARAESGG
jgi:hypothetical protein